MKRNQAKPRFAAKAAFSASLLGLASVVLLSLAGGYLAVRSMRATLLRAEAERIARHVRQELEGRITEDLLNASRSEEATAIFERFSGNRAFKKIENLRRVKIWDAAGRLVWSDEKRLTGRLPGQKELRKALARTLQYELKSPDHDAPERKRREGPLTLETFIPLWRNGAKEKGRADFAVEIYTDAGALVQALDRMRIQVWTMIGVAGLAVYLIMLGAIRRNESLYRKAAHAADRLSALQDLSRRISSTLDPEEVLTSVVEAAANLLNADRSRIFLLGPDGETLQTKANFASAPGVADIPSVLPVKGSLTGAVSRGGKPIVVGDVQRDDRWDDPDRARRLGIHGFIGVPLILRGEVGGVLICLSGTPDAFRESDVQLMEALSAHAAVALENARAFEESRRKSAQLARLNEINRNLNADLELEKVLGIIIETSQDLVEGIHTGLYLVDAEGRRLIPYWNFFSGWDLSALPYVMEVGQGLGGWVAEHREAVAVREARRDPRWLEMSWAWGKDLGGYAGVPLQVGNELVGILSCFTEEPHEWTPDEVDLLKSFAAQAAVAIHNAQLHDELEFRVEERTANLMGANQRLQREISNRKRAEEALRESEARLRAVVDTAVDGIITIEEEGTIASFNAAATRIFGYAPDEVMGRNVSVLMPLPDAERHDEHLRRYRQTGQGKIIGIGREVVGRRKDGTTFPLDLAVSEVRLGDRRMFTGIVRDITDLKRAKEALLAAKEEAERANRAKSEFLAHMSHEIRTPLNGIIGMTALLLETGLTAEQREDAETVRGSAEALLTIINDILDFSKIEAGKLELEVIDFDLRQTVEHVIELLAHSADAKGLAVHVDIPRDLPTAMRGDPGRIRQILMNLIGNAIKFTDRGKVALRAGVVREAANSALLRFEVSDTGIGIAPESQKRLFRPFSQAEGLTTRKYGGTGLGLAICKRLTKLMGGEIGVQSEPGKGSTFWFTARLGKRNPADGVPSIPGGGLRGLRVLVVDDNEGDRALLRRQLASAGVEARCAGDGRRALEMLREAAGRDAPYDLAVVDLVMPGMDGMETARIAKADPAVRDVRLVMLTSFPQRGHAQEAKDAGFDAYLTKPVTPSQLTDCIALVRSRRALPAIVTRHTLAEARKSHHRGRVLVAEDNPVNQRVTRRMLERLGYRVDVAPDGREAVRASGRVDYGLILMDCLMPEMDGLQATAEIRRREERTPGTRRVPIIALTANALKGDRERCLEAGMDDYLSKPVRTEDLSAVLERWANGGGAAPPPGPAPTENGPREAGGERGVDARALEDLRRAMGEEFGHIVGIFLDQGRERIEALRKAADRADAEALRRTAHTLKGSAGLIGAAAMASICRELQEMGSRGETAGAEALIERLADEFARVEGLLERERERVAPSAS